MENKNKNFYAVIMAGGVGSRFWPVSTVKFPKQFHDMLGVGATLLQGTYNRLSRIVPAENILILTHEDYRQLIKEQLPAIKDDQIIPEPVMRNTAPCILLSALKIVTKNPDALMLVAPSDHWIKDEEAFAGDVRTAFGHADSRDGLITIGINPHFANTGYGYIKAGEEKEGLMEVMDFTEKPDQKKAEHFLEEGNYLWNSGIFIWKAAVITERFAKHLPKMYDLFEQGRDKLNTPDETDFIKKHYPEAENISIDYGIMEKSANVYVIPASFDWNDLGTWGSLYSELDKDPERNAVVNTRLLSEGAEGNVVYAGKEKLVVIDGLKDYIIVEDKNVLLIVPRNKEQQIKELRNRALKEFGEELG